MHFGPVEENLRHSFRLLASVRERGEVREAPGVTIASAGVAFQMFNAAFLSAPVEGERELDRRVAMASVHFGARGLGWSYWVCDGWLDRRAQRASAGVFKKHGLYLATVLPGMIAGEIKAPVRTLPKLEIRTVARKTALDDFCEIGSLCFNVPIEWFREVFEPPRVWGEGFQGYVGYQDGEPVTTAATVAAAGVIGVYNVATIPARQRHGFGEAVMRYAIREAQMRHGLGRAILQSTPQGFALYRRMGFSVVTNVAVYSS